MSASAGAVVVVGSANLDQSIAVASLPTPGETVLATDYLVGPGGKGGNQAVAAARAGGVATTFICSFGDDAAAHELQTALEQDGIAVLADRHVGPSGHAVVMRGRSGENSIVVVPGANARLTSLQSPGMLTSIAAAQVVLMQLETSPALIEQVARAKRSDATLILNAAPSIAIPDDLWQWVDLLVVNEHEAVVYSGATEPSAAAAALLARVPSVIVTLGARGSIYSHRDGRHHFVDARPVDAVDTTAAGDTFCGVLAAQLSQTGDVRTAMEAAAAAAALTTLRLGAQAAIPTFDDVVREQTRDIADAPSPRA